MSLSHSKLRLSLPPSDVPPALCRPAQPPHKMTLAQQPQEVHAQELGMQGVPAFLGETWRQVHVTVIFRKVSRRRKLKDWDLAEETMQH